MEKLIIIKYGELNTKKDNINYFLNTLKKNILFNLQGIDVDITFDKGRMFIESKNIEVILEKLKNVFGIHEILIAYKFKTKDINHISSAILEKIPGKIAKTALKIDPTNGFIAKPILASDWAASCLPAIPIALLTRALLLCLLFLSPFSKAFAVKQALATKSFRLSAHVCIS